MAGIGQHAFWVKLDSLQVWIITVAEAHNRAVIEPGRDLEASWQRFAFGDQRVVARRREGLRQACKHSFPVVQNW